MKHLENILCHVKIANQPYYYMLEKMQPENYTLISIQIELAMHINPHAKGKHVH